MLLARALLVSLTLGILLAPLAADAQQPPKVPRIGALHILPPGAASVHLEAFRQGLRELGYVEGQNIAIEYRYAEGRTDRYAELAGELAGMKVDVIVVWGVAVAQAAQKATKVIPVVFALADRPDALGLVASLARPGGNLTGLTGLNFELSTKRLELLKDALPKVRRVAALWSPYVLVAPTLEEINAAARTLAIQLQSVEVRGPEDFEGAFARMTKERAGALLVLPGPLTFSYGTRIADLALRHRLPAIFHNREFVEAGGLMSYAPSIPHMSFRAATFVDKILKGAKPADLPVERPTRFELLINLKTAKALGLTIPQAVLIRADQVIQ
jgi:putative ABC transport system substrate-binding protein